jgi:hypothetical protein
MSTSTMVSAIPNDMLCEMPVDAVASEYYAFTAQQLRFFMNRSMPLYITNRHDARVFTAAMKCLLQPAQSTGLIIAAGEPWEFTYLVETLDRLGGKLDLVVSCERISQSTTAYKVILSNQSLIYCFSKDVPIFFRSDEVNWVGIDSAHYCSDFIFRYLRSVPGAIWLTAANAESIRRRLGVPLGNTLTVFEDPRPNPSPVFCNDVSMNE